jgi:hypothetical protein
MSKKETDYKNTVIYKIVCKDPSITDIYVGHTTNFLSRFYGHRSNYNYSSSKVYKTIRENGGWDNWEMIEIEKYPCDNCEDAKKRELYHYQLLNAKLNTFKPYVEKPNIEKKREKPVFKANSKVLMCNQCNYETTREDQYERHLNTEKHKRKINGTVQPEFYECKCGKKYSHLCSLCKHKHRCKLNKKNLENTFVPNTTNKNSNEDLIINLLKKNQELERQNELLLLQNKELNDIVELSRKQTIQLIETYFRK